MRSIVLLCSIVLGIWGGTFITGFMMGMMEQYVDIVIEGQLSHMQVHNPGFKKDKDIHFAIGGADELVKNISGIPGVRAASARMIVNGMATSPVTGAGVSISGIDPAHEDSVTRIGDHVIDGTYFTGTKHNPVLIGEKLAKKLKVKVGGKIVLTFQDVNNNITAGAFRVTGIFHSRSSAVDASQVFVRSSDLSPLLGQQDSIHEIAILLKSNNDLLRVQAQVKKICPGLLVENWKELQPDLNVLVETMGEKTYVIITIILLALLFGITNTMLMAVLERTREIGILMAIGMNRKRVFSMVMLETIFLALIGGPLGLLFAWITIHFTGTSGIDLSAFAQGLSSFGFDSTIYPTLQAGQYENIFFMVLGTSVLAAVYPSLKALRLKPADAIRKI
ncbi:MAG TPA: FtsX-like permease family protein [Bacteroidia bacterium]|nr:FtsX-like permease family protein [Bacteroidia bacterium]